MDNKYKKNKEILKKLNSGNPSVIISAIRKLREIGNTSYLPDIFSVYHSKLSNEVKNELSNFICDLKDRNAAQYIVDFIKKINKDEDISLFTSSCWQSRISFSEHVNFFTKLIISGSYQTSIEAFTVIENCLQELNQNTLDKQIQTLKNSLHIIDEEKKPFIIEIIKTLQT